MDSIFGFGDISSHINYMALDILSILFQEPDSFFEFILTFLVLVISISLLHYIRSVFVLANSKLIDSNPTSVSNSAIPKIIAITIICLAFVGLFLKIIEIIESWYDYNLLTFFLITLEKLYWEFLMFVLLLALAGSFLKPQILNVNTVSDSTTAEDIIGIYSIFLKGIVYFSNYLSLAFITYGALNLIINILWNTIYGETWSYYIGSSSWFFIGLIVPVAAHIAFLALMSINNYLLAILAIPKINKN